MEILPLPPGQEISRWAFNKELPIASHATIGPTTKGRILQIQVLFHTGVSESQAEKWYSDFLQELPECDIVEEVADVPEMSSKVGDRIQKYVRVTLKKNKST